MPNTDVTTDQRPHRRSRRTAVAALAGAAAATTIATTAFVVGAQRPDPTVAETPIPPTPLDVVPVESVPGGSVPVESVPVESVPVESVPVESVPVESVPVESVAADTLPAGTVPDGRGELDGAWSTDGARLVDGDGDEVHIRGVNWFGFETQAGVPHGLWTRNLGEMLDQIAELGFNVIRVPFSAAIIGNDAPVQGVDEQANPDLAGRSSIEVLDTFIAAAAERGLGVILDRHTLAPDNRHHLWYDDAFPAERLVSDWEFLAERYRDVPNLIGADLYNEPHDEACWGCGNPATDWKAAATEAADALHRIEPDWLVFVEGVERADGGSCDGPAAGDSCTWWGGDLSLADTDPVDLVVDDKVVYSPHEYATSVFRQSWFDDPTFPANMPAIWDRFWGGLDRSDAAPVMVGEFGTTLDADIDAVWLDALLVYLDEIGAGFTFWTFNPNSGDTGGILEDDWITVDEDKLEFLAPYLVGPFEPVDADIGEE